MRRVYFIRPIGMKGPIKIGCSVSPDGRRASLESWSPFPLEIIAEIDGDEGIERRFHAAFVHLHKGREWFNWSHEIDRTVAAINAGGFDVASLPAPLRVSHMKDGKPIRRTLEHRRQMSLSGRLHWAEHRSGYARPHSGYDVYKNGDTQAIAKLEAFIAAPHLHGLACPYHADKRAEYHAHLERLDGTA
ncbi:hypothetical protein BSL82_09645 [Tardibacter chloracetimidivorans]|uniref:Bacteriophage T5 Orf172 DNA-binding domain-containing protein n=1 Tax=Tardibacter chloracetimidivorans TaxID=1921510 RepID=A0A1L3ZV61_9SPHN|nr:GIY-YIG nuclease family protein [Tardibacter chloracetimidivorans]API59544.1 hypothetical protein BSL82_09645 [Tardibacter chloracetimidivorans]